ncbi:MAG: sugar phosphate isomerase/epimerase [Chloroflexi bacterium]|nr:sugar phosphate isomerase/epimerase [Chloroflexota bacterium]
MTHFRIGHTGITWGYGSKEAEQAVKDTAELGYSAYETFGSVLEEYEQNVPGGFGAVLKRFGIPLSAAYCWTVFYEPKDAQVDIDRVLGWSRVAAKLGADAIVLQAGKRSEQAYPYFKQMGEIFNTIGREVKALGMVTAIHPHTGTIIETREEIDAILHAVDPDLVGFAPDTGQIAKGGADAVATLADYKTMIKHVHLKDWGGGRDTGYADYEVIGGGVVDMAGIFRVFEEANYPGWVMVELDGTPNSPRPAREAAALSKAYLTKLLGDKAIWAK